MREFLVSNKHIVVNAIALAALVVLMVRGLSDGVDSADMLFAPMGFFGFLIAILNADNFWFSVLCCVFTVLAAVLI